MNTIALTASLTGKAACVAAFAIVSMLLAPALPCKAAPRRDLPVIKHDIKVRLFPEEHRLVVEDAITFPESHQGRDVFYLHAGLDPRSLTEGWTLEEDVEKTGSPHVTRYRLRAKDDGASVTLRYEGAIHHELESIGREYARGFRRTAGTIGPDGVYLDGDAHWYPRFDDAFVAFDMEVTMPSGWDAVSQGNRHGHRKTEEKTLARWCADKPQDDIFLVAGRFTEYTRQVVAVQAMVFLRSPDAKLAAEYLDATGLYLPMYAELLGPYPYGKFALVENFWETGYGMPSFTLMGPRVIRFPFIRHSSYPHEILHNWWGNSVYPDYGKGNWSEGLTAYLSDHLIQEQRGQGAEYRQTTLQKYADYVLKEKDFPLTAFTSRHSSATEAIGYGKALMFFHMLRGDLGDEIFVKALREFYDGNKFHRASYDDLQEAFSHASGKDLAPFFARWTQRPGAPDLRILDVEVKASDKNYLLSFTLRQEQNDEFHGLDVPVAVTIDGQADAVPHRVKMRAREERVTVEVSGLPVRVDADPEYDLFRRLHRDEVPPAFSRAFGASHVVVVLPAGAAPDLLEAYRDLANAIGQSGPDVVEVRLDKELTGLPRDRSTFLLGWENGFLPTFQAALSPYKVEIEEGAMKIANAMHRRGKITTAMVARHPDDANLTLSWIATDLAAAANGLGRKLPHYHKYSYLVFEDEEPVNIAKGRWPVIASPLTVFPGLASGADRPAMARLPKKEPLARLPEEFSKERMLSHITFLADKALQGRGYGAEGLDHAAEYLAGAFREAGLSPGGDDGGGFFQSWSDEDPRSGDKVTLRNVIGVIAGSNPKMNGESVVVGAHYDHLGLGWPDAREGNTGVAHPGADDNASGVAVLLELARLLAKAPKPERSIVFAAFAAEETDRKGSRRYVAHGGEYPADRAIAMINLDTVGRMVNNKILLLGAESAREWVHIFRGAGYVTGVNVEMVTEPLDASDQISFHNVGVPAVQLFTGPHLDYHRPTDTMDKINADGLVKVATLAKEAVIYLAGREEPLSSNLKGAATTPEKGEKKERKVSLGTIPDFAHDGTGYKLSGVAPGSPAEAAGLQAGDVIVRVDTRDIASMRDMSESLKSLSPGESVEIVYLREGGEITTKAKLESH